MSSNSSLNRHWKIEFLLIFFFSSILQFFSSSVQFFNTLVQFFRCLLFFLSSSSSATKDDNKQWFQRNSLNSVFTVRKVVFVLLYSSIKRRNIFSQLAIASKGFNKTSIEVKNRLIPLLYYLCRFDAIAVPLDGFDFGLHDYHNKSINGSPYLSFIPRSHSSLLFFGSSLNS